MHEDIERTIEAAGATWERIPVTTHLVHVKEPLEPVLDSYVRPLLAPGDWVALSEKVVAISEGRVIHRSVVKPGLLAKLIVKGVMDAHGGLVWVEVAEGGGSAFSLLFTCCAQTAPVTMELSEL